MVVDSMMIKAFLKSSKYVVPLTHSAVSLVVVISSEISYKICQKRP